MTTEGNTTFPRGDKRGSVSQKNEKKNNMFPDYPSIATWCQREFENVAYLMRSALHWANVVWEYSVRYVAHNQQRHELVTSRLACRVLSLMTVILRAHCLRYVSVFTVTISHIWTVPTPGSLLTPSLHDIWLRYLFLRRKNSSLWDQHAACLFVSVCWLPVCVSVGPPFQISKHWQIFTT